MAVLQKVKVGDGLPHFYFQIDFSGWYYPKLLRINIFVVDITAANPTIFLAGGSSRHGSHVLGRASTASVSDRNGDIKGWISHLPHRLCCYPTACIHHHCLTDQ